MIAAVSIFINRINTIERRKSLESGKPHDYMTLRYVFILVQVLCLSGPLKFTDGNYAFSFFGNRGNALILGPTTAAAFGRAFSTTVNSYSVIKLCSTYLHNADRNDFNTTNV